MFKKILAYALTVCLLISATVVPAYAVDEVYNIADDVVPAPVIYYTEDYYPGLLVQMRNSMTFANNRVAHGSFATMNYNPSIFYREGSVHTSLTNYTIPFDSLTPYVTADQMDISGVYSIPRTTLLRGNMLIAYLPSTSDAYFDFQSSNIAFDQQDANANTFYINGTLTFNLRNLWNFSGTYETTSFYLASDPLAVQLLIDGKAYGDIIDVTGYTSPFTALYNGGVPANASVTFNNLKVYYQGDTPDMVGFRVYTGSAFTDGQYNYNSTGEFVGVDVTNTVTMRFTDLPDITFVQEGGDGYAGDLSSISGALSSIYNKLDSILSNLVDSSSNQSWIKRCFDAVGGVNTSVQNLRSLLADSAGSPYLLKIYNSLFANASGSVVGPNGNLITLENNVSFTTVLRYGLLGLRTMLLDPSGVEWGSVIDSGLDSVNSALVTVNSNLNILDTSLDSLFLIRNGSSYLNYDGTEIIADGDTGLATVLRRGILGLSVLDKKAQSYVADTVFKWQSYNMDTHQLNSATNITGQNNLFFTAFQSIEDKLGRLAYVFGSDEDLALKDAADPSTDAFRQDFGGGASLSDIKDSAELATSVPQLMDSGFNFADGIEEIGSNNGYLAWFSAETWAALDSTGAAVAADPDYLSDYYDNLRKVEDKRHWGD